MQQEMYVKGTGKGIEGEEVKKLKALGRSGRGDEEGKNERGVEREGNG